MTPTLGYLSLLFMGLMLGLIGSGGSILTIPILLYFFKIPILQATTYSLAIVATIAMTAAFSRKKDICFEKSISFLLPSGAGVVLARHFIVPILPITIGGVKTASMLVVVFCFFMIIAGFSMIHAALPQQSTKLTKVGLWTSVMALFLGLLLGLLGAGGGFLIIPYLIFFMGLPQKQAIATSLFVITINSLLGLLAELAHHTVISIAALVCFLAPALTGLYIGSLLSPRINPEILKKGFGYFLCLMAVSILFKEFFL